MKKLLFVLFLGIFAAFACTGAEAADQTWDEFVARAETREKIKTVGAPYFEQTALLAPEGNEYQLWKISCTDKIPERRTSASAALVKMLFPNGDPSRWEEVSGFFSPSSCIPRQLVAVNALFNAVIELNSTSEEGQFAAAYLLTQFGKSSRGKLYFVDTTTKLIRQTIDMLVEATNMPGDWSSTVIKGTMPFVRYYDGARTRDYVEMYKLQYIDGCGRISENGLFAWDRRLGCIYRIMERPFRIWDF